MLVKDRPIGEELNDRERDNLYKTIIGGVSWPAKHSGYAVMLGMARERVNTPWCAFVVDQYESEDIHDLVHQCCVLDKRWKPDRWLGDPDNDAAFEIMCAANRKYAVSDSRWRGFKLCPPLVLESKRPYEYMMTQVKYMMSKTRTRLFLKDARVGSYMRLIQALSLIHI